MLIGMRRAFNDTTCIKVKQKVLNQSKETLIMHICCFKNNHDIMHTGLDFAEDQMRECSAQTTRNKFYREKCEFIAMPAKSCICVHTYKHRLFLVARTDAIGFKHIGDNFVDFYQV